MQANMIIQRHTNVQGQHSHPHVLWEARIADIDNITKLLVNILS